MKDRVDTKSMSDEHGDGDDKREETKDAVSRDELFPPIGEACKEEAANGEDNGATAVHVESVTGAEGSRGETGSGHSKTVENHYQYQHGLHYYLTPPMMIGAIFGSNVNPDA